MKPVLAYLLAVNILAFALMGADKSRAKRGRRRIPERTLLLLAAVGGSPGVLLGMEAFRHKTLHRRFSVGVPVLLTVQVLAVLAWALRRGGG